MTHTKDEALKLALEFVNDIRRGKYKGDAEEISTAIEQALEQPVQQSRSDVEPVALIRTWHKNGDQHAELVDWGMALQFLPDGEHCLYTTPPAQPASEEDMKVYRAIADNYRKDLAAAQRPWFELTDEEIEKACVPLGAAMLSFTEVARAIEAKLKEKNT
jgi:hypothetical protein